MTNSESLVQNRGCGSEWKYLETFLRRYNVYQFWSNKFIDRGLQSNQDLLYLVA